MPLTPARATLLPWVTPPLPAPPAAACRAQRDVELEALDREFDEHYDDICSEETARAQLRAELGPGPDGRAQSAHDAPLPVAREDDDDAPPRLDLGVERISLAHAGSG